MSCLDVFSFHYFWGLPKCPWEDETFSSFHHHRITHLGVNLERPRFLTSQVLVAFFFLDWSLCRLEKCHTYSLNTLDWWISFDLPEGAFLLELIRTSSCPTPQCSSRASFHNTNSSLIFKSKSFFPFLWHGFMHCEARITAFW